jgi:hypothetical protein
VVTPRALAAWLVGALLVMGTFGAAPARADGRDFRESVEPPLIPRWLSLPLESGHAAAWVEGRPGPVFRWAASLAPGVYLFDSRLGLQLPVQYHYRNPGHDLGLGLRATFLVHAFAGGFVPLRLAAESAYLVRGQGFSLAGGFMVGLGSLVHVLALGGKDTDRDVPFVGLRVGLDLLALGDPVAAITRHVPQADLATPPPTRSP